MCEQYERCHRYASLPVIHGTSMFAAALYNEHSRRGLVMGFLDHDLFKTGIKTAIVGVNWKPLTRDQVPHGMVDARDALMLSRSVGLYGDWREGMEDFASMQTENLGKPLPPPAGWDAAPIASWNSWAMAADLCGLDCMDSLSLQSP